jgi:hypothetical protein
MSGCRGVGMPGCRDAGVSGCRGVRMPGCRDAGVSGCRGVGMPGCRDAGVSRSVEGRLLDDFDANLVLLLRCC